MFKYSKLSILALATAGMFSACSKLDQDPQSSLSDKDAVTEANARILANGMYSRMQTLEYYGRDFMVVSDLGGVDMKITSQNSSRFLNEFQLLYTPLVAPQSNTFLNAYRVVNQANVLINQIAENSNTSSIRGEAYFMRALANFDLARRYCRPYSNEKAQTVGVNSPNTGIALVTTSVSDPNAYKPSRSTLEETYNAIIADLKVAQEKAPTSTPGKSGVFKGSKDAATALLSRAYLAMKSWDNVITESSKLIGKYELYKASEVVNIFNADGATSEEIFSVRNTVNNGLGSNNFGYIYVAQANGGYGDIRLTEGFMKLFEENDARKGQILPLDNGANNYLMKFSGNLAQGQVGLVNVRVLRISEVLLNRAEAYNEKGDLGLAVADVNSLRANRGLTPFVSSNQDDIRAEIKKQRRIELVGEGFGMFDLFRKNDTRDIPDANALRSSELKPSGDKVAYPIPQTEIDTNPNMVQNPGY
ncbi:RagB/SusD family nutrient uptake outer membrane protein [Chitinophaga silvatica]|uniref:RagB/SusD family nutrient uptake outer membrane protein n=1 Tax=Chitinophaga silvatica TaxID=2282649 RepID=A0A3E1Y9T9_9BACT|nr:RagB/SusD family nutrient uptake outer membrane protein [Chitinophaga silvatica]RFS22460.1 RagB/SusD family nutrient uptake outer membrane protein [Chitinophaga silvatica]